MFENLLAYVDTISSDPLKKLLGAFLNDEKTADLFRRAPAAKGFHHIYLGGLLEHTLSVVRLLDQAAKRYPQLNRDLLIAGGILHDIGKIYEFSYDGLIEYSDEGRMIGHLVMGVEMINKKMEAIGNFPERLALELRHIILSHHGEFEFGSPKRPKTREALVIHFMDDLDAKLNAFDSFVEADAANAGSEWTAYNRFFERYLYKESRPYRLRAAVRQREGFPLAAKALCNKHGKEIFIFCLLLFYFFSPASVASRCFCAILPGTTALGVSPNASTLFSSAMRLRKPESKEKLRIC